MQLSKRSASCSIFMRRITPCKYCCILGGVHVLASCTAHILEQVVLGFLNSVQIKSGSFATLSPVTPSAGCVLPSICRCDIPTCQCLAEDSIPVKNMRLRFSPVKLLPGAWPAMCCTAAFCMGQSCMQRRTYTRVDDTTLQCVLSGR